MRFFVITFLILHWWINSAYLWRITANATFVFRRVRSASVSFNRQHMQGYYSNAFFAVTKRSRGWLASEHGAGGPCSTNSRTFNIFVYMINQTEPLADLFAAKSICGHCYQLRNQFPLNARWKLVSRVCDLLAGGKWTCWSFQGCLLWLQFVRHS